MNLSEANSKKRILIAANDAGGSHVLAAYLKEEMKGEQFDFALTGPAVKIFTDLFGEIVIIPQQFTEKEITTYKQVITATGWGSDLEKKIIIEAKKHSIPCSSMLDHWTEYPSRFTLNGKLNLPDEIWVTDHVAQKIAAASFPKTKIVKKENYYLLSLIEKAKKFKKQNSNLTNILYCTEPTSEAAQKRFGSPDAYGYTEFTAMEKFFECLSQKTNKTELLVRLRTHPAEAKDKYQKINDYWQKHLTIEISTSSLEEDLGWSDWIVGCNSMVMAIGIFAQKKVFCAIPNKNITMSLPFTEIIRLF